MRSSGIDLSAATWRKSSYSDGGLNNCVEVADGIPGALPVRDSKNSVGPTLVFPARGWSSFVSSVKFGELLA